MSIEEQLERIAVAAETIVKLLQPAVAVETPPAPS